MLRKPALAKCDDRRVPAKTNPRYGEPDEWMTTTGLASLGLRVVSFDFFVDWSKTPPFVENELWVKRIADSPVNNLSPADILAGTKSCGDDTQAFENFAQVKGFNARYVVFRDGINWGDSPEQILFTRLEDGSFTTPKLFGLSDVQKIIHRFSGGPICIGSKGLIYGTSSLECHLSHTDALWPGDLDCLLWSMPDETAIAILEFKRHTLATPLANENIQMYMSKDTRKWRRLALMRDRISAPLICVFYSTNPSVHDLKLDKIEGQWDAPRATKSSLISIRGLSQSRIGVAIAKQAAAL